MSKASLHPVDELAGLRLGAGNPARERELRILIASDREARVGLTSGLHVVVTRHPHGDVLEFAPVPTLERYLALLSGPLQVVDTETTGLHHMCGDRVTSVAILPGLVDGGEFVAGEPYYSKVNPGRPSSAEALEVHGMDEAHLADKPPFESIAQEVGTRLEGSVMVAHNAPFDVGFLEVEFAETPFLGPAETCADIVDTRVLSKVLWPDLPASLDPMAVRLGVDRAARDAGHEALLDTEILARCLPGLVAEIRRRLGLEAAPPAP